MRFQKPSLDHTSDIKIKNFKLAEANKINMFWLFTQPKILVFAFFALRFLLINFSIKFLIKGSTCKKKVEKVSYAL